MDDILSQAPVEGASTEPVSPGVRALLLVVRSACVMVTRAIGRFLGLKEGA